MNELILNAAKLALKKLEFDSDDWDALEKAVGEAEDEVFREGYHAARMDPPRAREVHYEPINTRLLEAAKFFYKIALNWGHSSYYFGDAEWNGHKAAIAEADAVKGEPLKFWVYHDEDYGDVTGLEPFDSAEEAMGYINASMASPHRTRTEIRDDDYVVIHGRRWPIKLTETDPK
jgi:hypothetical protein